MVKLLSSFVSDESLRLRNKNPSIRATSIALSLHLPRRMVVARDSGPSSREQLRVMNVIPGNPGSSPG